MPGRMVRGTVKGNDDGADGAMAMAMTENRPNSSFFRGRGHRRADDGGNAANSMDTRIGSRHCSLLLRFSCQ